MFEKDIKSHFKESYDENLKQLFVNTVHYKCGFNELGICTDVRVALSYDNPHALGRTTFMGVPLSKAEEIALTSVIIDLADGRKLSDSDVLHQLITNSAKKEELESDVRELKKKVRKLPTFFVGDMVFILKEDKIVTGVIASITMDKTGTTYWYDMEKSSSQWKFTDKSIGKTVFATKEAATIVLNNKESEKSYER